MASSAGFVVSEEPKANDGAAADVASFFSVAPKENVAAGFVAAGVDPKPKSPVAFSSDFFMASPKLKLGAAASLLSFLSPVAPKPTTGAVAKAEAKLGGLDGSSGFGNEGAEAEEDPKANSEGFSGADVVVVAAVVVTFVVVGADDPKPKRAGGLSAVVASVESFAPAVAADPKEKVAGLVADSVFFSAEDDDEPNEKMAGIGAEAATVVVVVAAAVVVVVVDWPNEKERAGLGSEVVVVDAAAVVVATVEVLSDDSAGPLGAAPNENPPKLAAVVTGATYAGGGALVAGAAEASLLFSEEATAAGVEVVETSGKAFSTFLSLGVSSAPFDSSFLSPRADAAAGIREEGGGLKKLDAFSAVNVVVVDDNSADSTVFGSLLASSLSCSKTDKRFSALRFSFSRSLSKASMLEIVGFRFSGKRSDTEKEIIWIQAKPAKKFQG